MLNSPPTCLVPGAGLGRLALEISCRGYIVVVKASVDILMLTELNPNIFHTICRFHKPGK